MDKALLDILRKAAEKEKRLFITLDGPCASGKTTLARALAQELNAFVVHTDDFVVPHAQKTPERLAIPGGNCDAERLLRRRRRTRSQTRLHGEAKAANVAGAFALRAGGKPDARHILLVDDVFTTGATLAACHRALRTAFRPDTRISVATLGAVGE